MTCADASRPRLLVVAARADRRAPARTRCWTCAWTTTREPLDELRRLVGLQRAYARVDAGDQLAAAGDAAGALREYAAAHRAQPNNSELAFWHGAALAAEGAEEEAAPLLRKAFASHPGWAELLARLPAAGLFPNDARSDRPPDRDSCRVRPE